VLDRRQEDRKCRRRIRSRRIRSRQQTASRALIQLVRIESGRCTNSMHRPACFQCLKP
jgi:hypothetical protein